VHPAIVARNGVNMFKQSIAVAAVALACTWPALAEETKMHRTLSLSGHGEIRAVPDLATISLGVFTNAASAQDALAANSASMTKLMEALKSAGVADKDIQTSNFSVNPSYEYRNDGSQPVAKGFDVSNQVTIAVRKIEEVGKTLDQAVAAGANQINGITFSIDNPDEELDNARKEAVKEARRKAELYAAATGVSLGSIINIIEGGTERPQPIYMAKGRAESAAAETPVQPGEQIISMDVTIVWEIK
jgi:uncharacterized protein